MSISNFLNQGIQDKPVVKEKEVEGNLFQEIFNKHNPPKAQPRENFALQFNTQNPTNQAPTIYETPKFGPEKLISFGNGTVLSTLPSGNLIGQLNQFDSTKEQQPQPSFSGRTNLMSQLFNFGEDDDKTIGGVSKDVWTMT